VDFTVTVPNKKLYICVKHNKMPNKIPNKIQAKIYAIFQTLENQISKYIIQRISSVISNLYCIVIYGNPIEFYNKNFIRIDLPNEQFALIKIPKRRKINILVQTKDKCLILLRKLNIIKKMEFYTNICFWTQDEKIEIVMPLILRVSSRTNASKIFSNLMASINKEYAWDSNEKPNIILPTKFSREKFINKYNVDLKKGKSAIIQLGLPKPITTHEDLDVKFTENIKVLHEREAISEHTLRDNYMVREFPIAVINEEHGLLPDMRYNFPVILLEPMNN